MGKTALDEANLRGVARTDAGPLHCQQGYAFSCQGSCRTHSPHRIPITSIISWVNDHQCADAWQQLARNIYVNIV